jgi:CysZ protein
MARGVRQFFVGLFLPLKGSLFLLRHRGLLALAMIPLGLNVLLYAAALVLLVHYYDQWFALLLIQPSAWYLRMGYEVLHLLAFLLVLGLLIFSFVFVGTALAAPFLEVLSVRVETILRGCGEIHSVRFHSWLRDSARMLWHAFLLILLLPLSLLPGLGHALWLIGSWLLLAYNFAAFALERRRWSVRAQWRLLRSEWTALLGFGMAVFGLMLIPLGGLVILPIATVAGTLLVVDIEARHTRPHSGNTEKLQNHSAQPSTRSDSVVFL